MNCECVYYSKSATRSDLLELAKFIEDGSKVMERYPVSLSVITKRVKCFDDYDGWGKSKTIPAGSEVLFVGGKYSYMVDICNVGKDRKTFCALFPDRRVVDFFEDIQLFED